MNSYYQIVDLGFTYNNPKHSMFFWVYDGGDIFGQINWFIEDRQSDPAYIRVFRYKTKKQWDTAYDNWIRQVGQ